MVMFLGHCILLYKEAAFYLTKIIRHNSPNLLESSEDNSKTLGQL